MKVVILIINIIALFSILVGVFLLKGQHQLIHLGLVLIAISGMLLSIDMRKNSKGNSLENEKTNK